MAKKKRGTKNENFSNVAEGILEGLREVLAYKRGEISEKDGVKIHRRERALEKIDVKNIRHKLGLNQSEFAVFINTSTRSVQHWEQHTRAPEGPTLVLLKVLEQNPSIVWNALRV